MEKFPFSMVTESHFKYIVTVGVTGCFIHVAGGGTLLGWCELDNRPPWPFPLTIFLLRSPLKRVSYFLSETKCTALFYYGNSAILEITTSINY